LELTVCEDVFPEGQQLEKMTVSEGVFPEGQQLEKMTVSEGVFPEGQQLENKENYHTVRRINSHVYVG
jgi:hypothetical protein